MDVQVMGPDWNLVARGAAETLVMLVVAVWFLLKIRRGAWAPVGALAALTYAAVHGTLTVGLAIEVQSRTTQGWLSSLYEHSAVLDGGRIVCLGLVVIAFMLACSSRRTRV